MTSKEIKKELDEMLKPIKSFCKRWDVNFEYGTDTLGINYIIDKVDELINLLNNQDNEQLKLRIYNFVKLKQDLDLLATSMNHLSALEATLVYQVLLIDKSQIELAGDKVFWTRFNIEYISAPKINVLFRDACFNLLEMIKYNQIKNLSYTV